MNKNLDKSLRQSNKKKEDKVTLISGNLGIPLNGQKLVEVPNRKGFVFVRLKDNTSELIQAYNTAVSPIYDLPVLVARQVGVYKVIGRNVDRYQNVWGQAPYLPKHGAQHSFNPDINIGGDIVWVYSQQMMPLLVYPSGSSGSPRLTVAPYIIRDANGAWKYVGNTGTPNTTPYNPTTGSRAVIGLVYLDTVSGNPQLLINSGTYIDSSMTGTNQIVDYIPRSTDPNWIPLAAIRLVSGSTQLSWNNVYDVRPFLQVVPTGTGGGSNPLSIQDEGIPLGTATTLNVVGVNADVSISGSVARLFITGSSGNVNPPVTGTVVIQDEGIVQGSVTTLNFVGANVQASVAGGVATISVTGSTTNPPITGSFVLQDDGQTLGGVLLLNVGRYLTASISGSIGFVDIDLTQSRTEDLTSQVNGTGTNFQTSFVINTGTAKLYYNGIRQGYIYHYTISGSFVKTLFTPLTGSILLLDYL